MGSLPGSLSARLTPAFVCPKGVHMVPVPGQMVTWVHREGEFATRRPALVIRVLNEEAQSLSLAVFVRPGDIPEPYRMREPVPACVCSEPVFPPGVTKQSHWWEPLG